MSNQMNYEKTQENNETIKKKLIQRIEELKKAKSSKELALKSLVEENLQLMEIIAMFTGTKIETITVQGITYNTNDNEKRSKQINENNKTKQIYKGIIKQLDDSINLCERHLNEIIKRENDLEELYITNSINRLFSVSTEEKQQANKMIKIIEDKISKIEEEIKDKKELKITQGIENSNAKKEYVSLEESIKAIEAESDDLLKKATESTDKYIIKYIVALILLVLIPFNIHFDFLIVTIMSLAVVESIFKLYKVFSVYNGLEKKYTGSEYQSLLEKFNNASEKWQYLSMTINNVNEKIEKLDQEKEKFKYLKLILIDFQNGTNIANILYQELSQELEIEEDLGISRKREIPAKNNED